MIDFPINIEIIRDISFFEIAKTQALIALYNYAADKNIQILFYVDRSGDQINRWRSFSCHREILVPFDSTNKKIIPDNTWLQKIYLAHEIAHQELNDGARCRACFCDPTKRKSFSTLYNELRAWIRGWEVLRWLGIAIIQEEKKYKIMAGRILIVQCAECLDVLREKAGQCPYEIQIRNLLKAYGLEQIL